MDEIIYPTNQRQFFARKIFTLLFCCILCSLVSIQASYAQLEGHYTIGDSAASFTNFTEALQALEAEGTSGPVTFNVQPGIYQEQLILGNTYDSVTFEGVHGDSTAVILEYPEDYVMQINGGSGYTFRYLTISGTEGAVSIRGVKGATASDLLFEHNLLQNSGTQAVINSFAEGETSIIKNHIFRHNRISGEGDGFSKRHSPSTYTGSGGVVITDDGLELTGNTFITSGSAITVGNQSELTISHNTIEGGFYGMRVYQSWTIHEINHNHITVRGSQSTAISLSGSGSYGELPHEIRNNYILAQNGGTGIHFHYGSDPSSPVSLVANNIITINATEGSEGILINDEGGGINFFHNSLYLSGEDESSIGLHIPADFGTENVNLLNNIIANEAGGYSIYVERDPRFGEHEGITTSDYNNLYSSGSLLAHWQGEDAADLAEWRTLTEFDENSLSVDPQFESAESLIPSNAALEGSGIALEEVTTDFFGNLRNDPPAIGAAEFEAEGEEPEPQDPLAGIYTIGGESPDFEHFNAAVSALEARGIADSVTFLVRPGTYREQITLTDLRNHHITFEGESGDSTDVVIEYPEDYVLRLQESNYITFRHLTISGTANAVQINGSQYILFESNVLKTSGADAVVDLSFVNLEYRVYRTSDFVTFRQNRISGQGRGINGTSFFVDPRLGNIVGGSGHEITNNTIEVMGSAIYFAGQGAQAISDNTIILGDETSEYGGTAIHLELSDIGEINRNEITVRGSGGTGIRMGGITAQWEAPHRIMHNQILLPEGGTGLHLDYGTGGTSLIANNMISVNNDGGSNGILINNARGNVRFYFNNVLLYGDDANSHVVYITEEEPENVHFINNIFTNTAGGMALYFDYDGYNPQYLGSSDYNNLYTNGEILASWQDQEVSTLEEWQALTGYDQHSLSVDPQFESTEMLIPTNAALKGAGIALDAVTTDFFGNLRNDPPTIGAVEFDADGEEPGEPVAVIPIVECVVRNQDGSFTATFGYINPNQDTVQLATGNQNFLNLMEYAGQPVSFAPGQQERAFHVVYDASESPSWTLGDTTVTVNSTTPACDSPVQPVEPLIECVSEISRNLSIATLGYHNPNNTPVAIATGRLNRMIGRQDQGQPTVFEPGMQQEVFAVSYTGALMWTLAGQRAMVNRDTPACSPALQAVQPILDCVSENGDGTYTAHFGYHNPNEIPISVGARLHNQLLPAFPGIDELPTTFEPGWHERVFSVPFRGQRLAWRLMGSSVVANRSEELACGSTANARTAGLADESFEESSRLEVYPNPFSNTLRLNLADAESKTISIRIFAISSGMLLMEANEAVGNKDIQLDLEQLGAGAYIMEVKNGEEVERIRIMKH